MDFEAQRKKRMEDLAIKRKRLEEMRKQRSEKNSVAEPTTLPEPTPSVVATPPPSREDTSVDDLVNSLLSSDVDPSISTTSTSQDESNNDSPPPAPVLSRLEHTRQRSTEWTTCQNVCSFTILPVVPEVYEKGIQTEVSTDPMDKEDEEDTESTPNSQESSTYHRSSPQKTHRRSRGDSIAEEETQTKPINSATPAAYTPEEVNEIVVCV
jgi:hypothetical protein